MNKDELVDLLEEEIVRLFTVLLKIKKDGDGLDFDEVTNCLIPNVSWDEHDDKISYIDMGLIRPTLQFFLSQSIVKQKKPVLC